LRILEPVSDVEREMLLPASPDEVWESLADPERLSEWFGADVEGRIEPGEVLTFTDADGTQRRAIVEFVEPGQRLVFRYLPFEKTPDGASRRRESSRVAIHIEPYDGETVIRITETRVGSAGTPRPQIGFHSRARA
jgi:uncharacterized protein YndB with AHSA1/START domain